MIEKDKVYKLYERGGLSGLDVKVKDIKGDDGRITVELLEIPAGFTPWRIGDELEVFWNELVRKTP
jgi:hypothetical protein